MKKINSFFLLLLVFVMLACSGDNPNNNTLISLDEITEKTYPKVDCSTSAEPLQTILACKLLGLDYEWRSFQGVSYVKSNFDNSALMQEKLKVSGTHESYMNLIDGKADLILVARKASDDEKEHAKKSGVKLLHVSVALDAFIFITHLENKVSSLTTKQIQQIYQGHITNWKELGGADTRINPYVRNENSGSHELMKTLVMKDLQIPDYPFIQEITGMTGPYFTLQEDVDGICYTVYYYNEFIMEADKVNKIAIDGVYPDYTTLKNRKYPYTTDVYAVIRADLDQSDYAYAIYKFLQEKDGKEIIEESGYIAN